MRSFELIISKLCDRLSSPALLFFIFFLSFSRLGYGQFQTALDSLIHIDAEKLSAQERCTLHYSQSWYAFNLGDYSATCDYAKKALRIAKANDFDSLVNRSSIILGSSFINKFEYDSAVFYLREGYNYLEKHHPKKFVQEKTRLNIVLGDALANQMKYAEAIVVHEKNLKTSRELKDTAAIITSLLSQARLYKDVGLYSTSLDLLAQCEPFVSIAPYIKQKSAIYGFSASVHSKMEDFPKAINNFKRAVATEQKTSNKSNLKIGDYYFNMSEIYFDMEKFDAAFAVLDKAKAIFQRNNDSYRSEAAQIREAKILVEIGEYDAALQKLNTLSKVHSSLKPEFYITYSLALKQNRRELAITYADSSRFHADQQGDLFALKFAYEILSDLHGQEKNWELAYRFKQDFEFMTDSLFKIEELRAVQKIEVNKIYAEKNAVILDKDNKLKEEISSKEQLRLILLTVVALAVILLLIFMLRAKAQKTKRIEAENARLKVEHETEQLKKEMQNFSVNGLKHLKFVERINDKLDHLKHQEVSKADINNLTVTIKQFLLKCQKEEAYNEKINLIETSFFEKLEQSAELSKTEKKLCTFLKLEMSSKEISDFLHVSEKTVEVYRSRLRKKLSIPSDRSFEEFFAHL